MKKRNNFRNILSQKSFTHNVPFSVRLEILSSLFRKKNRFTIRKRKILSHVRRAIRARGWTPQERIVFVRTTKDTNENHKADDGEMLEDGERVSENGDQLIPMEDGDKMRDSDEESDIST